jgi:hypothetical protein
VRNPRRRRRQNGNGDSIDAVRQPRKRTRVASSMFDSLDAKRPDDEVNGKANGSVNGGKEAGIPLREARVSSGSLKAQNEGGLVLVSCPKNILGRG